MQYLFFALSTFSELRRISTVEGREGGDEVRAQTASAAPMYGLVFWGFIERPIRMFFFIVLVGL